ncbi:hypothetical protein [Methylopila sp. M107]|uniref:hypothetical protein n=1 Tax=Methylopila sp. M107 TaxID=1101190 RepID=UPI0003727B54|nr:hypothetical protein [Methylopila sp. M107]
MDEATIDYRRALAEAAAHFERQANSPDADAALRAFCADAAATCRAGAFPIPALDPARR